MHKSNGFAESPYHGEDGLAIWLCTGMHELL
jgi:hypothetical protein